MAQLCETSPLSASSGQGLLQHQLALQQGGVCSRVATVTAVQYSQQQQAQGPAGDALARVASAACSCGPAQLRSRLGWYAQGGWCLQHQQAVTLESGSGQDSRQSSLFWHPRGVAGRFSVPIWQHRGLSGAGAVCIKDRHSVGAWLSWLGVALIGKHGMGHWSVCRVCGGQHGVIRVVSTGRRLSVGSHGQHALLVLPGDRTAQVVSLC
jgi:hypothetical protein